MSPRDFALLAQEAYTAPPNIGVAASASRAIVRDTAAGLVVAFPGTDNHECVGTDMDMLTVNAPGIGEVHKGFWLAWQAIAAPVEAAVGEKPVIFVGHSLGAAIAILAAWTRYLAGQPVAYAYGFEPPHISPHALTAPFPLYLSKNGNDVVPELPLMWHHAGPLTQIGKALHPFANIQDHELANVIAALTPR